MQRAFYPEGPDVPHVYLLHPPGGVVGGDRLETRVSVGARARALLTTPAAQKLYRSTGPVSEIQNLLTIGLGAALEWLPSEALAFAGAQVQSTTRVALAEEAGFIGWEMTCFGMPARGEGFSTGQVMSRFEIIRGERPLLIDALNLRSGNQLFDAAFALRGQPVVANLYAVPARGVISLSVLDAVREAIAKAPAGWVSVSSLDELLVVRALVPSIEAARVLFVRAWQTLRPLLLDRPAVVPRIWAT